MLLTTSRRIFLSSLCDENEMVITPSFVLPPLESLLVGSQTSGPAPTRREKPSWWIPSRGDHIIWLIEDRKWWREKSTYRLTPTTTTTTISRWVMMTKNTLPRLLSWLKVADRGWKTLRAWPWGGLNQFHVVFQGKVKLFSDFVQSVCLMPAKW